MRYDTIRRDRKTAPAATICITQPVLPVFREEFGITAARASLTVSAVIFGIALATLPFGLLVDRLPARPILLAGRLLAGFLYPPLHWRYAFVTASALLPGATLDAARWRGGWGTGSGTG